ncbi:MAG: hypothetical protein K8T89_23350 [Planctomycetes bacterium]|nr:hypothetical protein [Planctomycetota bacterium]
MLTSTSAQDRAAKRTWWFVYGVWAALTLQALHFVIFFPTTGPIIDEWEFIPAVTQEEPFWPFLWKLHNEHRFPLPRLIWLPLTQFTKNFQTGCYISLIGMSLVTVLMIRTAAAVRGRLHFADAFFPISMLHLGHWENWRMGYQICFMLNLVLAAILLRIIVLTKRDRLGSRGIQAGVTTLLLLGCGAGGLAFGPFMALWLGALIYWLVRSSPNSGGWKQSSWLLVLAALIPVYVILYLQGFHRPGHHADPLEVWGSTSRAAWQALRSALQSLSMAFGPAGSFQPAPEWIWTVFAVLICLIGFICVIHLLWALSKRPEVRPRTLGLLLYLSAMAFMAYGIGWGRCVFLTDDGKPGYMGLSSRYAWIMWPAIGAIYFIWLTAARAWLTRWIPIFMFVVVTLMLPFNIATGYKEGLVHREYYEAWEKSVREGKGDEELIDQYFSNYYDDLVIRIRVGLALLRKHEFLYFRPLEPAMPPRGTQPQRRRVKRSRLSGSSFRRAGR